MLGGISSGKSAFAESLVQGEALYVATALGVDDGMQARIAAHRRRRPADWPVFEAVERIAPLASELHPFAKTVLLDGFGLVVGSALASVNPAGKVESEVAAILADSARRDWIVVSEESGLSPVALTPIGREFQDLLGRANQLLSRRAAKAYLVVAGRPLELPAR